MTKTYERLKQHNHAQNGREGRTTQYQRLHLNYNGFGTEKGMAVNHTSNEILSLTV